jgi:8-oxo-dGTP pyrophosphatase MutT (NUDIX family)
MAFDQIAVLPYRVTSPAVDAPVQILLITSRGTGRWVIPKGRPIGKLPPHASAAVEAEEEAGVLGAASATANAIPPARRCGRTCRSFPSP